MEHTSAILLRKSRWSESSLIVTWLTAEYGTLKTSARGGLRPGSAFAGKLDLFHQAEIGLTFAREGSLHSLREVDLRTAFDASRVPYSAVMMGAYFCELAAAVAPPMQPAMVIHDLLSRALVFLQENRPTRKALEHYERELCRNLGIWDESGRVQPQKSLADLCGQLPSSRQAALQTLPA